jgi:hypothetical protein
VSNLAKIKISDVGKKHLKIVGYLAVSGILGYVASLFASKPELAVVIAPVINYVLYALEKELKKEGFIKARKG